MVEFLMIMLEDTLKAIRDDIMSDRPLSPARLLFLLDFVYENLYEYNFPGYDYIDEARRYLLEKGA